MVLTNTAVVVDLILVFEPHRDEIVLEKNGGRNRLLRAKTIEGIDC